MVQGRGRIEGEKMAGARGGEVWVRETQIEPNVVNARVDTVARGDDTSGRPGYLVHVWRLRHLGSADMQAFLGVN